VKSTAVPRRSAEDAGRGHHRPDLNEAALRDAANIMKAKKKQLDVFSPSDLGVDVSSKIKTLKVSEPPKRVPAQGARRGTLVGQTQERSEVI